jgi:pyruvate formate lyase activating enzyme
MRAEYEGRLFLGGEFREARRAGRSILLPADWPVIAARGYMCPQPRAEFYRHIDAANVDLKGFTAEFYRRACLARLDPVLETLLYLRHQGGVWLEITNLLIPGLNDSDTDLDAMSR